MASEWVELIVSIKDLATEGVSRIRSGIATLDNASKAYNRTISSLSSSADAFGNRMKQLAAVVGVAGVARSFVEINSSAEKTKFMLEGLMGSAEKADEAFNWILDFSTKAPFSIEALKDSFVKLQVAGLDPMHGSLQTLSDAIAAFGGNDEDLKLAAVAIQQMAGKGVISMEELRQQLGERLPTAMKLMAEGLGMSMDKMIKEIENGNVKADEGLNALFGKLKEVYGGQGEKMMSAWVGLISNVKVEWTKFMLTLGQSGIFDRLKEILIGLFATIQEIKQNGDLNAWANRIAQAVQSLITLFLTFAGVFGKIIDAIGPVLPALVTLVAYVKSFQLVLGGVIGMPVRLATQFMAMSNGIMVLMNGAFGISSLKGALDALAASLVDKLGTALNLNTAALTGFTGSITAVKVGILAAGAALAGLAGYGLGKLIDNLAYMFSGGNMDLSGLNRANELIQQQKEQIDFLRPKVVQHTVLLEELGFKGADAQQKFNDAVKAGEVVFDAAAKKWHNLAQERAQAQADEEERRKRVTESNRIIMAMNDADTKAFMANIKFQIEAVDLQYKEGLLSAEDYYAKKKDLMYESAMKEIEQAQATLEMLQLIPEKNKEEIIKVNDQINSLMIKYAEDLGKLDESTARARSKSQGQEIKQWQEFQDLRISMLKSQYDREEALDQDSIRRGEMTEVDALNRKLQRDTDMAQTLISNAQDVADAFAQLYGQDSLEYAKAAKEKERLQGEYEVMVIDSEATITEAQQRELEKRRQQQQQAQALLMDISESTARWTTGEIQAASAALEQFQQQSLISSSEYLNAWNKLQERNITALSGGLTDAISRAINIYNSLMDDLKQSLSALSTEGTFTGIKNEFTTFFDPLKVSFDSLKRDLAQFAESDYKKIFSNAVGTFFGSTIASLKQLYLYGRDVTNMSAEQVRQWAGRVTQYVQYVQDLFDQLRNQVRSYQDELDQLRGNDMAILDRWYQSELDALNEKYGEELKNTKEYEEALTLLKEIYAEKRKKILDDEKKAQEDYWGTGAAPEEQQASVPSGAAGFNPNADYASGGSGLGRPGDIADRVKNSAFGGIMDAVTSRIQDVVTSVNQAMGTINGALPKEMTVEKNFKFESSFSIPSLDKESTRRWVRETLGPELDEYYRLRGVKL